MPGYIHHIQWSVTDLQLAQNKLSREYGMKVVARREAEARREVVLQSGSVVFLLSETVEKMVVEDSREDCYPWLSSARQATDSVFNICLHVGDVRGCHERMTGHGAVSISPPRDMVTSEGLVSCAVVTSPCSNVVHSLVNTDSYSGHFLPGYTQVADEDGEAQDLLTSIDHVTFVCEVGESRDILDWYKVTCGMERFLVSHEEDPDVGTVMEDVGMKLSAGSWVTEWLCREEGVAWTEDEDDVSNFKLVLAEPLPGHEDSHVNKFLRDNGGAGVQHIGLSTRDISHTMRVLNTKGAEFRRPPPTYYSLQDKQEEIRSLGQDMETFKQFGILIDKEQTDGEEEESQQFILQIFSFPVFGADTFFLEIIQRQNSRGFGGGNIRALAHSIIEFKRQREKFLSAKMTNSDLAVPGRRSTVHHCNQMFLISNDRNHYSSLDDFYGSKKYHR